MTTVLLRLEGPLQAWSAQGKLGIRDTEREPTKSGVLGFVAAALGMARDDDATLGALRKLVLAVRVDRPGSLLRDYHTVGGGRFRGHGDYWAYDTKSCIPSERYYLQDASFTAALEGDPHWVDRIATAVRSPRWPLFLGRRSCPPSVPPFLAVVAEDAGAAVRAAGVAERVEEESLRIVLEASGDVGDPRYDVPLSFAEGGRRYGVRYVRTEWVDLQGARKAAQS